MDENTWRLAQIMMWVIGIQTGVLGGLFLFMWNNLSKRIDDQSKIMNEMNTKIGEIDKRLYGIETVLHMKDCCVLKQDQALKKAE